MGTKPITPTAAVTFDLWQTLIFEFDGSAKSDARRKIRADYGAKVLAELGESDLCGHGSLDW